MTNPRTLLVSLALSAGLLLPTAALAQSGPSFTPGNPDPGAVNPRIPTPDRELPDRDRDGSPDTPVQSSDDAKPRVAPLPIQKRRKNTRTPKAPPKPVSLGELDGLSTLMPAAPEWAPDVAWGAGAVWTLQPCSLQEPNGRWIRW